VEAVPSRSSPQPDSTKTGAEPLFLRGARNVEQFQPADPIARWLDALSSKLQNGLLRGDWLGHALHPLLTDIPLGCWTAAAVLDLFGDPSKDAARFLTGAGVLAAVPTAAAGAAEWQAISDRGGRRVAVVHAGGNAIVVGLYLKSWLARRAGKDTGGRLWGLAGGVLALATGYLGGHLSFGLSTGVGVRGRSTDAERDPASSQ
jgi:uncharacterized membrane protein